MIALESQGRNDRMDKNTAIIISLGLLVVLIVGGGFLMSKNKASADLEDAKFWYDLGHEEGSEQEKSNYWINESYFEKLQNPDGFLHYVQLTPEDYECLLLDKIGIVDYKPTPSEHLDGCLVAKLQEKT